MFVIIGGGAAGIFAAICAKAENRDERVVVLEKSNQLLSKVRISGGGRCNVTHACFEPKELVKSYPRGAKELLGPFHTFGPRETFNWFKDRGVPLKTERDGRMFPHTDSSETIIDALLNEAERLGVEIRKRQKIQSITAGFEIELASDTIHAERLILATGSNAWGHEVARRLGHAIVDPVPSLFTFNTPSSPLLDLAGISLEKATLTLKDCKLVQTGPLLLTHWGFSGPAALKLSAWGARKLHAQKYRDTLTINWTCAKSEEALFQSLLEQKKGHPKQTLSLPIPQKLLHRLLGDEAKTPVGQLSNKQLHKIAAKIYADPYSVEGKTTYKSEFVTAGGVKLSEVNFKTMESRITPGLHFAGEILNIDGITGGFNFQNAWTTAYLAATEQVVK